MNLSMSSCSDFLSIYPKTISKKSMLERTPGEELVFAKSKTVSLVSNEMNVKQSAMLDSGFSCSPENDRMTSWNSDLSRIEK